MGESRGFFLLENLLNLLYTTGNYAQYFVCVCIHKMATHSSILARRIPWMEEPGGLQSIGPQRVGYD